jgi:hypothetical protein
MYVIRLSLLNPFYSSLEVLLLGTKLLKGLTVVMGNKLRVLSDVELDLSDVTNHRVECESNVSVYIYIVI